MFAAVAAVVAENCLWGLQVLIAAQYLQLLAPTVPVRPSYHLVLVLLRLCFLVPDHVVRVVVHLVGRVLKVLGIDMPNGRNRDTDDIDCLPTVATLHSLHSLPGPELVVLVLGHWHIAVCRFLVDRDHDDIFVVLMFVLAVFQNSQPDVPAQYHWPFELLQLVSSACSSSPIRQSWGLIPR